MDMYPRYKSKFGYQIGNNQIDSYGVDHSGFTTQDEVAYQFAREEKENSLLDQLKKQGITENFPQYGTNFWGNSANNYGFGMTNIAGNIANMQNNFTPIPSATAMPQQQGQNSIQPQIWETAAEGKQVYDNVVKNEGNFQPENQNLFNYGISAVQGGYNLLKNYFPLKELNVTDKYKHALMNCQASQYGQGGADIAELASNIRETHDRMTGSNKLDNSMGDQYANMIGRLLGSKYSDGDCNALIQKYIKRKY